MKIKKFVKHPLVIFMSLIICSIIIHQIGKTIDWKSLKPENQLISRGFIGTYYYDGVSYNSNYTFNKDYTFFYDGKKKGIYKVKSYSGNNKSNWKCKIELLRNGEKISLDYVDLHYKKTTHGWRATFKEHLSWKSGDDWYSGNLYYEKLN